MSRLVRPPPTATLKHEENIAAIALRLVPAPTGLRRTPTSVEVSRSKDRISAQETARMPQGR